MLKRFKIKNKEKRHYVIIPFKCLNPHSNFRFNQKWWRKEFKYDKMKIWGMLGVSLSDNFESRLDKDTLVATQFDRICSTEYTNIIENFYV